MSIVSSTDTTKNPYAAFNSGSAAATSAGAATGNEIQDRFLALLVAQMKNQDPLNPLDNAQVTSQMAQINTVNGIEKLNQTVNKLMSSNQSMQGLQAAAVVGHEVLAEGNALALTDGSGRGGFDLPDGADSVTITVTSGAGQVVHRETMQNLAAGIHTFTWDGATAGGARAIDGKYSFGVSAATAGKPASAQGLAISRIDGVSGGGADLTVRTSNGTLAWSKIRQVM